MIPVHMYVYTHRYAHALLGSLATPSPPPAELDALRVLVEEEWRRVVMFFMLRLTLAPCVESVLLLDRAMFLIEQGNYHVIKHPPPTFHKE